MNAEMYNDNRWIESDVLVPNPHIIKSYFDSILKRSGFEILGFVDHKFEPQGYTALWLLAESHLAIHTFPEHGTMYVEMSSCVPQQYQRYIDLITDEDIYEPKYNHNDYITSDVGC